MPMKPSGQKESRRTSCTEVDNGGGCLHDGLRHIKRSLDSDTFRGEDGGLRDVDLQTSICLEDGLELSQNL
jgi:hypothetical protein